MRPGFREPFSDNPHYRKDPIHEYYACLRNVSLRPRSRQIGEVRDIYDLGDRLLLVATDRISAFDWINPVGIPDKGKSSPKFPSSGLSR